MYGKDTTKSTFNQLFSFIFTEEVQQIFSDFEVDKNVKKLSTWQLLTLLILSQEEQLSSLRAISDKLYNESLKKELKIDSISHTQISRRLGNLSTEALVKIFQELTSKIIKENNPQKAAEQINKLNLIDSTTISLCLSQYPWAEFRSTKSGIKIHLKLNLIDNVEFPDKATITPAKQFDKAQIYSLIEKDPDYLNVFDRAYVDYKDFDNYTSEDIRFVTRLKSNAVVDVVKELPIEPDSPVIQHQLVKLGNEITYKTSYQYRLIKVKDTEGNLITIVTNDLDLAPEEIGDIYRKRWQIETFFKWMKQNLDIKKFYGTSQQAVENQVYIALIIFCLMKLIQ